MNEVSTFCIFPPKHVLDPKRFKDRIYYKKRSNSLLSREHCLEEQLHLKETITFHCLKAVVSVLLKMIFSLKKMGQPNQCRHRTENSS